MDRLPALLLFISLTGSSIAHAQPSSHSGLGYKGGAQAAKWYSAAHINHPTLGFAAGFYAPVALGNRLEIQPEMLLSLQGTSYDLPDEGRIALHSLHVVMPVSAKLFVTRSFNLQVGGYGSYLLLGQAGGEGVSEQLSKLDLGVTLGLGIDTWSGLDFTLRYLNGLSNTLKEDRTGFPATRILQLTVGKRFTQFSNVRHRR